MLRKRKLFNIFSAQRDAWLIRFGLWWALFVLLYRLFDFSTRLQHSFLCWEKCFRCKIRSLSLFDKYFFLLLLSFHSNHARRTECHIQSIQHENPKCCKEKKTVHVLVFIWIACHSTVDLGQDNVSPHAFFLCISLRLLFFEKKNSRIWESKYAQEFTGNEAHPRSHGFFWCTSIEIGHLTIYTLRI